MRDRNTVEWSNRDSIGEVRPGYFWGLRNISFLGDVWTWSPRSRKSRWLFGLCLASRTLSYRSYRWSWFHLCRLFQHYWFRNDNGKMMSHLTITDFQWENCSADDVKLIQWNWSSIRSKVWFAFVTESSSPWPWFLLTLNFTWFLSTCGQTPGENCLLLRSNVADSKLTTIMLCDAWVNLVFQRKRICIQVY